MARNAFDQFCRDAVDFLSREHVPYVVVGGLTVAALGESRFTADADVVAFVTMAAADRLIASARAAGFDAAEDEPDRLRATGMLRFRQGAFQLDVIVASLPSSNRTARCDCRGGRDLRFGRARGPARDPRPRQTRRRWRVKRLTARGTADKGLAVQLEDMVRDESGRSEETECILRDWPLGGRWARGLRRGGGTGAG